MSSPTWTPAALSSEARPYRRDCWRLVEAQHHVSTRSLVDTLDEQSLLEEILEETKPAVPADCRHLDFLLSTPFRYAAVHGGSRFRRQGKTPGVFYAAESVDTAVAEMAFYRFLFYAESPDTPWPETYGQYTAFSARISTERMIDLATEPFSEDARIWSDPVRYAGCQDLSDSARDAEIEVVRYLSVRDPHADANVAVLTCKAFAEPKPLDRQTWRIRPGPHGAVSVSEHPRRAIEFPAAHFRGDPRLATIDWA